MTRPTVRIKVQPRARVKIATIAKFPAQVIAGNVITIASSGGVFTVSLDDPLLGPNITDGTINNTTIGLTTRAAAAFTQAGIGASPVTYLLELTAAAAQAFISQTNSGSTWLIGPTTGISSAGWGLYSVTAGAYRISINNSGVVAFGGSAMSGGVLTLQNSAGTATIIPNGAFSITLPG